jgi:arylsulfatase A-like enzyme
MSNSQPNVLWICTDQQRFDTLGCYGNEHVETGNLDRLAAEGVRFDRCYSQSPVCTPSRASFLTGRYPRTTRCRQNGQAIREDETLVTTMLADRGYTCGLSGKLHVAPCHPDRTDRPTMERRIDDGYADFHWSHSASPLWPTNEYHQWLNERGREYERTPARDSEYVHTSMPAEHHQTTWCVQKAVDFVERNADFDRPWLFSVNPFDPHHAFDPPEEYLEAYLDRLDELPLPNYVPGELEDKPAFQRQDHEGAYNQPDNFPYPEMDEADHRLVRAAYWAMIGLIDDQVGRLLAALDRTDQREDTLVIFTSDHGEMLGDHGIYLKGPYFYEPAVRVPLVVSGPGLPRGEATDALVELTDLAPTLLHAAGERPPPGMQGRSLWPRLAGDRSLDDHRESVYCEYYNAMPWHDDPVSPYGTMLRTDRHKLVAMHRLETGELYDLDADPGETTNRWDDPAYESVKADLLGRLATRMAETVDPLPERQSNW